MTKFLAVAQKKRKKEKYLRAALVCGMEGLEDAICVPIDEAVDLNALVCLHSFEGVSGQIWARRWLFGGGSSAAKKLTHFQVKHEVKEAYKDVKNFKAEFERSCNPRKLGLGSRQTRLCNIL